MLGCSFSMAGTLCARYIVGSHRAVLTGCTIHKSMCQPWLMTRWLLQVSWFPDLQAWHRSPTRGRHGAQEPDTEVHPSSSVTQSPADHDGLRQSSCSASCAADWVERSGRSPMLSCFRRPAACTMCFGLHLTRRRFRRCRLPCGRGGRQSAAACRCRRLRGWRRRRRRRPADCGTRSARRTTRTSASAQRSAPLLSGARTTGQTTVSCTIRRRW